MRDRDRAGRVRMHKAWIVLERGGNIYVKYIDMVLHTQMSSGVLQRAKVYSLNMVM